MEDDRLRPVADTEFAVAPGRMLSTQITCIANARRQVQREEQWAEARREHMGIVLIQPRTVSPEDIGGLVRRLATLLDKHPHDDSLRDRVIFL